MLDINCCQGSIRIPLPLRRMAMMARGMCTPSFSVTREATEAARLQVEVYPIPASNVINIKHEGKVETAYISLLDFNGNVLLHQPLGQQTVQQLDVSKFRKGIHYLKVVGPESLQIIRLVVE